MESSVSALAQRAREALGLESGSQAKHFLKYRQQHVHDYPSEYSLGEYSVAQHRNVSDVERLKPKYTECQKVHKLTARTSAQVTFLYSAMLAFKTSPVNCLLCLVPFSANIKCKISVGCLLGRCCGRRTDRLCCARHCEER